MTRNSELRTAWEFVEDTGRSIFLTGKAGTGKTVAVSRCCPDVGVSVRQR